MSTVTLHQGDCLAFLRTLEAGSVDAIVTDPPYGIDYQSARRTDRSAWRPKILNDRQPFVWWLWDASHLVNRSGCMIVFHRWDVAEPFRLAMEWAGFPPKSQLVWDRVVHGMGDLKRCPAPQHDVAWFAARHEFHFRGMRPKSVVRVQRVGGEQLDHPNEKPLDLMISIVESYVPEGGTVLDPFMGSGVTGEACVRTGRRFIGIEMDPTHFATATRRIEAERAKMGLFEGAAS